MGWDVCTCRDGCLCIYVYMHCGELWVDIRRNLDKGLCGVPIDKPEWMCVGGSLSFAHYLWLFPALPTHPYPKPLPSRGWASVSLLPAL